MAGSNDTVRLIIVFVIAAGVVVGMAVANRPNYCRTRDAWARKCAINTSKTAAECMHDAHVLFPECKK
jgi:hypothetical protein